MDGRRHRVDRAHIRAFTANPENPWLVSHPRTGSHWLRMALELYLGRPSLGIAFFFPGNRDYTFYHAHDFRLKDRPLNVIYLYRDPVDTLFSWMVHEHLTVDEAGVAHCAAFYGRHLRKWLVAERFTKRKLVLSYEELVPYPVREVSRVLDYLGEVVDADKLADTIRQLPREEVRRIAGPRWVQTGEGYEQARGRFRAAYGSTIWAVIKMTAPEVSWPAPHA